MIKQAIPTNVVTGFLGSGKTTALLHLLRNKPDTQRWAILVNEFGEIGIDGSLLRNGTDFMSEVPGGCMCCAAGMTTRVALNRLIKEANPDRILIEPTGLGHPREILDTLTTGYFADLLQLRATVTLLDPRKLQDARYCKHENFVDQLALADVLIANKTDLCSDADQQFFQQWLQQQPEKAQVGWVEQGTFPVDWLDLPCNRFSAKKRSALQQWSSLVLDDQGMAQPHVGLSEQQPFLRKQNQMGHFVSCGWLFQPQRVFDFNMLFMLLNSVEALRIKGVLYTSNGWFSFNADNGVIGVNEVPAAEDSRLEIIHDQGLDWDGIEQVLLGLSH